MCLQAGWCVCVTVHGTERQKSLVLAPNGLLASHWGLS